MITKTVQALMQGDIIKEKRRALWWTQRQLSEKAGVKFTDVSKIESGCEISSYRVNCIMRALEKA